MKLLTRIITLANAFAAAAMVACGPASGVAGRTANSSADLPANPITSVRISSTGLGYIAPMLPRAVPDDGWADPAPHRALGVTVAPGVRLHVLDFGGSGAPLVFLSGIGNNAHVFDDFAQ